MQASISTVVQQGGNLLWLLCVLYLLFKKAIMETLFNIIGFKLTLLSHRACFYLGILHIQQNISLRAAVQAAYLSFYVRRVNVVCSLADCDDSLSALH